jgi:hypothetical protein
MITQQKAPRAIALGCDRPTPDEPEKTLTVYTSESTWRGYSKGIEVFCLLPNDATHVIRRFINAGWHVVFLWNGNEKIGGVAQ